MEKRFIKYPEMSYLEESPRILDGPVSVFEKLDGGNCQVRKINGKLTAGSKSNFLEGNVINRMPWFQDFVGWVYTQKDLYNLDEDVVLFGEWLSFHNIPYDKKNMNLFYFIDMYDIKEGRIIPWHEALENLEMMEIDLRSPRVLIEGTTTLAKLELLLKQKSDYRSGTKEGLVIKDYPGQRLARLLHPEFSEIAKGRNLKPVDKYVTPTRARKIERALQERGVPITTSSLVLELKRDILRNHKSTLGERAIRKKIRSFKRG